MKKLFFALTILLAGCQSERVAFHFQPVAPTAGAAPKSGAQYEAAANNQPLADTTGLGLAAAVMPQPAAASVTKPQLSRRRAARAASAPKPLPAPNTAELPTLADASVAPAAAPRPLPRLLKRLVRQRATAGPAHTAENGLAGIFFFFLGVFLAVLAGLGALVSLLPGVSFFGGVGLAAAGLLVLFLLYRLFSGGGKKKTKVSTR